jgi:low temperature requirement protein LtrA
VSAKVRRTVGDICRGHPAHLRHVLLVSAVVAVGGFLVEGSGIATVLLVALAVARVRIPLERECERVEVSVRMCGAEVQ